MHLKEETTTSTIDHEIDECNTSLPYVAHMEGKECLVF